MTANLTYRPIKLWPAGWDPATPPRLDSPFTSTWTATHELLQRELHQIGAVEATVQLDVKPGSIRVDGGMRADAKVGYPGVILTVATRKYGSLTYPCNRFAAGHRWRSGSGYTAMPGWQNNLRAIALGLEALRKVERYGIADRGQQYAGWAELPGGREVSGKMSLHDAAVLYANKHAGPRNPVGMGRDFAGLGDATPFHAAPEEGNPDA